MSLLALFPILAVVVGGTPVGSTKSECRVQLVPADSSRAWIAATGALDSELRRSAPVDRDCLEIVVRANPDRPTVAVLTPDGRQAVRSLRGADDLAPTVQGMITTIFSGSSPESSTLPAPNASNVLVAGTSQRPTGESKRHLWLTAAGGGRLSFPGTLAAAVVDATAGLTIAHWEMGLFGSWSPGLPVPSAWSAPASAQPSFELGASIGHRSHLRFADVIIGGRAGTIRTSPVVPENGSGVDAGEPGSAKFLPSVGAFAGLALWPASFVRLRPQFAFAWLPTAGGPSSTGAVIPGWNLTLSIGAESGAL